MIWAKDLRRGKPLTEEEIREVESDIDRCLRGDRYRSELVPPKTNIREIFVTPHESPHARIRDGVVDWWYHDEIDRRVKRLEQVGSAVDFLDRYKSNKGLLHTGVLLNRHRGEEPLVWLAAFVKDVSDGPPDEWRGGPCILANAMEGILRKRVVWWHFSSRNPLPASPIDYFVGPNTVEDVCHMAWIAAHASMADMQLVVVSNKREEEDQ